MTDVLQQPTLVLNRNWQAVHVASVQRALLLLVCEAAQVVEPETLQLFSWAEWLELEPRADDAVIRSARLRVRAPEVVVLSRFDRLPRGTVAFSKHNVFKRDRYVCQYCGRQPRREELSLDHVVPRAQGGRSSWENCVLACLECNHKKADQTLRQAGMKLRRAPQRPTWAPLFSRLHAQPKSWRGFLS